jgi:hypothetical protein
LSLFERKKKETEENMKPKSHDERMKEIQENIERRKKELELAKIDAELESVKLKAAKKDKDIIDKIGDFVFNGPSKPPKSILPKDIVFNDSIKK